MGFIIIVHTLKFQKPQKQWQQHSKPQLQQQYIINKHSSMIFGKHITNATSIGGRLSLCGFDAGKEVSAVSVHACFANCATIINVVSTSLHVSARSTSVISMTFELLCRPGGGGAYVILASDQWKSSSIVQKSCKAPDRIALKI